MGLSFVGENEEWSCIKGITLYFRLINVVKNVEEAESKAKRLKEIEFAFRLHKRHKSQITTITT